jgi:hypothetical protein
MTAHASLQSPFPSTATRAGIPIGRFLTAALVLGAVLSGVIFACFSAFTCIVPYDDEGVVLLFVQHMLDGHSIYDRINCLYGPFYLFVRWLVFGVLRVHLGNDALRMESLVTWLLTTLLLAMTAWRLASRFAWRVGLTALVWILSVCQLFVLSREPGHPQEVIALLVAAALYVAAAATERRNIALLVLGGLGAATALTKVNVGVFYLLGLTLALLALTPRSSRLWYLLRCAGTCATVVLPVMLMRSRFGDGYGGFCFLVTCALLPGLALACFRVPAGTVGLKELLWCGLGGLLVAGPMLAFALWQGNTLTGMSNALFLRTYRNFASAPVGTPLPVSLLGLVWVSAATVLGLAALGRTQSWTLLLAPLRIVACVMVFLIAASRNHEVFLPLSLGLPLVWLLLVPPTGRELDEQTWFFRLFLCFTACLQPLQIFPVTGSQVLIGSLVLPIVAIMLALDVYQEVRDLAVRQPNLFASIAPVLKRAVVIAIAVASMRTRTYEIFGVEWTLLSVTSLWALLTAGVGCLALQFEPSIRKFLVPLKAILGGWIVAGMLTAPPWDMTWLRLTLPLCWLILIQSPGQAARGATDYVRLGLVAGACLELLHLLPVVHLAGRPFHFAVFLMVGIAVALVADVGRELGLFSGLRAGMGGRHAKANSVLLAAALLIGLVSMIDAEEEYRALTPLDLPGCHWTRMPERDAVYCTFLATNVRRSSDCVFARFGLESLHFWAQQRPASDVVPISNLWAQMDPVDDDRLLQAHRDCLRLLFIDNPNPWNPVPPKMKFLDFITSQFQLLGRVGPTRLLVRKGRPGLALYDCAFQRRAASGTVPNPTLFLRLPAAPKLQGAAAVELVDLARNSGSQVLKSTAGPDSDCLKLMDTADRLLLPAAAGPIDIGTDQSLRIVLPEKTDLNAIAFPSLRFLDADGRRTLTLPVVVDAADAVR